ncbi:MAG: hypothetical protein SGI77_28445 [Pirellulaceae bacterium]|nr:hypothetical protein [Pirellulaceae bacterium]
MSHEARHRDIAALLARGVIRVKKQPLVAKAIEANMQNGDGTSIDKPLDAEETQANEAGQDQVNLAAQIQHGGDQ